MNKTQSSFYRRLLIAHLIDHGIDTVPAIIAMTGMPRRTAQDTIKALKDIDIEVSFEGANKSGHYQVHSWGAINKVWVKQHVARFQESLGYPVTA